MTHHDPDQIKPDMPVFCSDDCRFATIDRMEGTNTLKLKKDETGQYHYIPLIWISSIDNGKIKVNRPIDRAMKEWSTVSPLF